MSMKDGFPQTLRDILFSKDGDPMGLLSDVKPIKEKTKSLTPVEQNFQKINDFYSKNGHEPDLKSANILEHSLAVKLRAYKARDELKKAVQHLDIYNLLIESQVPFSAKKKDTISAPSSLNDILCNDDLGLLTGIDEGVKNFVGALR
jgi:hypothetical protein